MRDELAPTTIECLDAGLPVFESDGLLSLSADASAQEIRAFLRVLSKWECPCPTTQDDDPREPLQSFEGWFHPCP